MKVIMPTKIFSLTKQDVLFHNVLFFVKDTNNADFLIFIQIQKSVSYLLVKNLS